MFQPLTGLRVLEIGDGRSAPLASRLLGDLGAYVLKVEHGEGDRTRALEPFFVVDDDGRERSALFAYLNWNKDSLLLDPSTDAALLRNEIAGCDVLVVGDDVRMLDLWGIEPEGLRREYPDLVVVTVTPYGTTGPKSRWLATDLTLQAAGGLMSISGSSDREPLKRGLFASTYETALTVAYSALAAVRVARHGGGGTFVDVSMTECVSSELVLTVPEYSFVGAVTTRRRPVLDPLSTGEPLPAGAGYLSLQINAQIKPGVFARILGDPRLEDERFETSEGRSTHAAELSEIFGTALADTEARDVFEDICSRGLLAGFVQSGGELLTCPHLGSRGLFRSMPGTLNGAPWSLPSWSSSRAAEGAIAPDLGSRRPRGGVPTPTASSGTATRLTGNGAEGEGPLGPLAGLRVLDLSTVFAAPYIGGLLRDLGAEVLKVEPPARLDQTRGSAFGPYLDNDPGVDGWNWSGTFHSLNRGKKSLVLDLKQQEGREVLLALVKEADILLENFTPRVMRGWGMTYEDLAAVNPRLIMLSNTGYGASGPWSSFKAQGTSLEATMGLTTYTGYPGAKPKKVGQSYPDFLAAWTGLTMINAALLQRDRTGRGHWVDLAMYELGAFVLPEALIAVQSGGPVPQRIGNHVPGTLLSGVFRCSGPDEWLAISLVDDAMLRAARALVPDLPNAIETDTEREDATAALTRWSADLEASKAAEELQQNGIAAAQVVGVRELIGDPQYVHRGFFEWIEVRDEVRPIVGRPYRWAGDRSVQVRGRGPSLGEHNDLVLGHLGLDRTRIAELREQRVVTDAPIGAAPPRPADLDALVASGVYREVDPEYRHVLKQTDRSARFLVDRADVQE